MSVTIRHLILDKLARKSYHQDDGKTKEVEMTFPSRFQKKWPHLMSTDESYEGGADQTPGALKKTGGIFGLGGK
jgi:hypothetical protein